MSVPKQIRLVSGLLEKSNAGKVKWEKTLTDGVFQVPFPEYSVQIFRRLSRGEYSEEYPYDYVLAIYNGQGELVEEIADPDLAAMGSFNPTPYQMMKELYEVARRTSMGVETAFDTILSELEDR